MTAFLEVWQGAMPSVVVLDGDRLTIGRASTNDVVLADDIGASRLHAVVERLRAGWVLRDLSSRNGTCVNGERVGGDRPLNAGDDIQVGNTRCVFRIESDGEQLAATVGAEPAPTLTPREREVLLALFRPALDATVFTEPASTREVAAALFVSEAAIKQHLANLYDKFGIYDDGAGARRVRLANEALRRGAVTLTAIRAHHAGG